VGAKRSLEIPPRFPKVIPQLCDFSKQITGLTLGEFVVAI
jgi:hypothetical protein